MCWPFPPPLLLASLSDPLFPRSLCVCFAPNLKANLKTSSARVSRAQSRARKSATSLTNLAVALLIEQERRASEGLETAGAIDAKKEVSPREEMPPKPEKTKLVLEAMGKKRWGGDGGDGEGGGIGGEREKSSRTWAYVAAVRHLALGRVCRPLARRGRARARGGRAQGAGGGALLYVGEGEGVSGRLGEGRLCEGGAEWWGGEANSVDRDTETVGVVQAGMDRYDGGEERKEGRDGSVWATAIRGVARARPSRQACTQNRTRAASVAAMAKVEGAMKWSRGAPSEEAWTALILSQDGAGRGGSSND
eukprot:4912694-Pleurochrysis_carterae.AAC.2